MKRGIDRGGLGYCVYGRGGLRGGKGRVDGGGKL